MELLSRYRTFDTGIVADALDQHGIDGVIQGLRPADPDHAAVGYARPLQFERVEATDGATNFPYAMLEQLAPDRMLVIDSADDLSSWGGNASKLAAEAGLAGTVVNGGFRDVNEISDVGVPVFGATPTPKTGQKRVRISAVDEPITVRGVSVEAEDVVVADATGVVVVPGDAAPAVADTAEKILGEELLLEEKIAAGATIDDLRADEHEF